MVELGDAIDPELNEAVRALDERLQHRPFRGYLEAVPSYRSLLIFFDPGAVTFAGVVSHVSRYLADLGGSEQRPPTVKTVPTVYDGEDLDDVARLADLSLDEVIRLHSGRTYRVYVVGFTPGFAYMGMTDDRLKLPRRSNPRTRVAAGSVAIAMGQTGIYPSDTPGGWHLLGRADPRRLFDVTSMPPSRFVPGDRVQFVPVDSLAEDSVEESVPSGGSGHPVFKVEDGGLLTTVQDLGRPGYQRYGVPVAGAMDPEALRCANALVGNAAGAAALECTMDGPSLRCLAPTVVAVTGADFDTTVTRSDIGLWRPPHGSSFRLRPGNLLSFAGRRDGARAYLGVAGGLDVDPVLGSRSTYLTAGFGGHQGRALRAGDKLFVVATATPAAAGKRVPIRRGSGDAELRIVWGPQDDYFTEAGKRCLVSSLYRVSAASDRMGSRLEGPAIEHSGPREIISDGNALGSIQVPPNGLPIVMLADRATTGGYPKIATVMREDVSKLAQCIPGESVRFRSVVPEAG